MARYQIIACHVLWREICYFASQSRNIFDFNFLEQGLHCTPDILRQKLQNAIDNVDPEVHSATLIGYGLCSNGIVGVKATRTKLVIVRGHDCITHLLGSKERYRKYFDSHPGTYWYSPGWIDTGGQPGKERYETTLKYYIEKYGKENGEYLMEMEQGWFKAYNNAAYVDLGVGETGECREYTKNCAMWLKWNYDELAGDPKLMQDFLEGNWDPERFLILEPGQTVIASNDEKIIKIKESEK